MAEAAEGPEMGASSGGDSPSPPPPSDSNPAGVQGQILRFKLFDSAVDEGCRWRLSSLKLDVLGHDRSPIHVTGKQAVEPGHADKSLESKNLVLRQIVLEADNLLWLVEIMAGRHVADEFLMMWVGQKELAALHQKLPIASHHLISCITARLFVGIGMGEMLPSKDTRQRLLQVWLQTLIDDYNWLQHRCRSFGWKVVEEGIGRTILTLPLEDQQSILLSWLGSFLKVGDSCPNLRRAFEVWWRRTFIRPLCGTAGKSTAVR